MIKIVEAGAVEKGGAAGNGTFLERGLLSTAAAAVNTSPDTGTSAPKETTTKYIFSPLPPGEVLPEIGSVLAAQNPAFSDPRPVLIDKAVRLCISPSTKDKTANEGITMRYEQAAALITGILCAGSVIPHAPSDETSGGYEAAPYGIHRPNSHAGFRYFLRSMIRLLTEERPMSPINSFPREIPDGRYCTREGLIASILACTILGVSTIYENNSDQMVLCPEGTTLFEQIQNAREVLTKVSTPVLSTVRRAIEVQAEIENKQAILENTKGPTPRVRTDWQESVDRNNAELKTLTTTIQTDKEGKFSSLSQADDTTDIYSYITSLQNRFGLFLPIIKTLLDLELTLRANTISSEQKILIEQIADSILRLYLLDFTSSTGETSATVSPRDIGPILTQGMKILLAAPNGHYFDTLFGAASISNSLVRVQRFAPTTNEPIDSVISFGLRKLIGVYFPLFELHAIAPNRGIGMDDNLFAIINPIEDSHLRASLPGHYINSYHEILDGHSHIFREIARIMIPAFASASRTTFGLGDPPPIQMYCARVKGFAGTSEKRRRVPGKGKKYWTQVMQKDTPPQRTLPSASEVYELVEKCFGYAEDGRLRMVPLDIESSGVTKEELGQKLEEAEKRLKEGNGNQHQVDIAQRRHDDSLAFLYFNERLRRFILDRYGLTFHVPPGERPIIPQLNDRPNLRADLAATLHYASDGQIIVLEIDPNLLSGAMPMIKMKVLLVPRNNTERKTTRKPPLVFELRVIEEGPYREGPTHLLIGLGPEAKIPPEIIWFGMRWGYQEVDPKTMEVLVDNSQLTARELVEQEGIRI